MADKALPVLYAWSWRVTFLYASQKDGRELSDTVHVKASHPDDAIALGEAALKMTLQMRSEFPGSRPMCSELKREQKIWYYGAIQQ